MDYIILFIIGVFIVRGFFKGIIKEAAGLIGFALAMLLAGALAESVAEKVALWNDWSEQTNYFIGWGVVFLGVIIVVWMFAKMATAAVEAIKLGLVNKILGGVFGGIKGLLILSLVFNVLTMFDKNKQLPLSQYREESKLYEYTEKVVPTIFPHFFNDAETIEVEKIKVEI